MNPIDAVIQWFADPAHWSGANGVPTRLLEHIQYSLIALGIAALIAVPLGLVLGHLNRGATFVLTVANGIRALPTLGLLTLLVITVGIGLVPPVVALVVMAVPPILVNTFEGIRGVDQTVVDAARGLGLRGAGVLLRVRTPIALPLILLGVRLATIQVVSAATIAAYVGLGGLGRYVFDGLARRQIDEVMAGSVLIALLAVFSELVLMLLTRLSLSPGVTRSRRFALPAAVSISVLRSKNP